MVFKPEPLFRAVEALKSEAAGADFPVMLLSPQGRLLTQAVAEEFARKERVVLVCGALRRRGRARRPAPGHRRALHRRLRAERRRAGGGRGDGSRDAPPARRARQRGIDASRILLPPQEALAEKLPPAVRAGFSIARTTRGRRSFAAGKFRKFCSPGITRKFAAGGAAWRWRKPGDDDRICSPAFRSARKTAGLLEEIQQRGAGACRKARLVPFVAAVRDGTADGWRTNGVCA